MSPTALRIMRAADLAARRMDNEVRDRLGSRFRPHRDGFYPRDFHRPADHTFVGRAFILYLPYELDKAA